MRISKSHCDKDWHFFRNERGLQDDLFRNNFLTNLFGSQYLFEICHTSITIKNSENVVKRECFEKRLLWRAQIFFRGE